MIEGEIKMNDEKVSPGDVGFPTYEIRNKLKSRGYDSAWDYLRTHIAMTYVEVLKDILGKEAIDLFDTFDLLFVIESEIQTPNQLREVVKDALVRYLREYSVNWKRTTKSIENRMSVYCALERLTGGVRFVQNGETPENAFENPYKNTIKKIWDYIEEHVPPNYFWLPDSPDDPLIVDAFNKCWSIDAE
jgi:hypothetical protein